MTVVKETLLVDLDVYSLNSIKRTIYRFSDKFSASVTVDGKYANCVLVLPDGAPDQNQQFILDEFWKELTDQDLRESIKQETQGVRDLILAHAFSQSGLVE